MLKLVCGVGLFEIMGVETGVRSGVVWNSPLFDLLKDFMRKLET